MQPLLSTENINKSFRVGKNTIDVLKNINISIDPGTLTVLRGKSGSGKTTLLNILSTLDTPTSGKVYFHGNDISSFSENKRDSFRRNNIGIIFQSVALVSTMTAYENVEFGMRIAGVDNKDRKKGCLECLDLVGLSKRANHLPAELSGGEQQRIAIARAIAHKPEFLFADEPTAELDTHMGLQVIKIFKDLISNYGITVLMTSHDPAMLELADKVYTLKDGEFVDE